MQKHLWIIFAALLFTSARCTRLFPAQNTVNQLLKYFPLHSDWPDTLHCFLADPPAGMLLSDTLVKTMLDSAQFESLHFGTGEARFWALGQFPFAKGYTAGILQTEEFWFGKQSLLIFDPKAQKCLAVVELAHFYGGDGGQTASESWLFRSKDPVQLFVKNAEHGLAPTGNPEDDLQEYLREHGQLFRWEARQFRRVPNPDSVLFLQRYVMGRGW